VDILQETARTHALKEMLEIKSIARRDNTVVASTVESLGTLQMTAPNHVMRKHATTVER
jgi:hypothetical protein